MSRGTLVTATGSPIQMPIGENIYGRLFNVIGDAIDGMEDLPKENENALNTEKSGFRVTSKFKLFPTGIFRSSRQPNSNFSTHDVLIAQLDRSKTGVS